MNDYTTTRLKTNEILFRQNNLKSPKTSREQVVPTAEIDASFSLLVF